LWPHFIQLPPESLSDDLLYSIHDLAYIKQFHAASTDGHNLDMDTYTTVDTYDLAMNAAGGALTVAHSVWQRAHRAGYALTRPPGHHATRNRGMGFCLLNNVALAAQSLITTKGAEKVAIIDIDLHHGNGTQDIFWERPDVLYISSHQYPHYPGTGWLSETGDGKGAGANLNIPLPAGSGDQAFAFMTDEILLPALDQFLPEMVLISGGFDVHWRDPLGSLEVSAYGYGQVIQKLSIWCEENCQGRIAVFLEGGYDLEAGAACALTSTSALFGNEIIDPLGPSPHGESSAWVDVLNQVKQYWSI
jgi:acetoin utilization deacetylase AcuC-like enzyme